MFTNLSRRERILLILLVVFAILALYYYALYSPITERIDDLNREISNIELQITRNRAILAGMPKMQERYLAVRYIEDEVLKNRIDSVPAILQILENEALSSGLQITSFSPQDQGEKTRINIEARGYYQEIINFLDGIKKLDGQIEFNWLRINKVNNESDLLKFDSTYIFHDQLIGGGDS